VREQANQIAEQAIDLLRDLFVRLPRILWASLGTAKKRITAESRRSAAPYRLLRPALSVLAGP
jgi:hypothetical protein